MCTLIIGRDVLGPGTVLIAANRDEDPARPSDPPRVLHERPRLVGGRDRTAGGTWLAVREGQAVVALLNRRDRSGGPAPPEPGRRSRGMLPLDVAGADEGGFREVAESAVARDRYAPFTLVFASSTSCWLMYHDGDAPSATASAVPIAPGWHVLTHADLDDASEPRTARLMRELGGFAPRSTAQAEARLIGLLRSHGDADAGIPAVCLHEGRMVTVSTSLVWLAPGEARYRHAEGRPCEHPLVDYTHLLRAQAGAEDTR